MKKLFRVLYFDPKSPGEIIEDEVEFDSEIIAKSAIRKEWYEIQEIYEIQKELTFLEKIEQWRENNVSTKALPPEVWLTILHNFAETRERDKVKDDVALEKTKKRFWKSQKQIRKLIDEMISVSRSQGISHVSDIFEKFEEVFWENFLVLMRQVKVKSAEINLNKIISNTVSEKNKESEVEWWVQLQLQIINLRNSIIASIRPPIIWFIWTFSASLWILILLVPPFIEAFSKYNKSSDYTVIWNTVIAMSNFLTQYGIYLLIAVIFWISIVVFLYNKNELFKEQLQEKFLKMWLIWDILQIFYTKRITSMIAVLYEAKMRFPDMFQIIIPIIGMIPIQKELKLIQSKIETKDLDTIFSSYSDDEKYLTEMFYSELASESNRYWSVTGRYGRACAAIIKNTDDLWLNLKEMPERVWQIVKFTGMFIVLFVIVWIMLVFIKNITGSI